HHVAWGGDDGLDPVPVRFTRDAAGIVVRPPPDTDVGRRFPEGVFRLDARAGTVVERVGGDELLFADGVSRAEAWLVVTTAPPTAATFAMTGGLVAAGDAPPDAARFWDDVAGGVRVDAAPPPDVARIAEILPWYVHDALV